MKQKKLFFVATVPGFFNFFRGQLSLLKSIGEVTLVSSPAKKLSDIAQEEGAKYREILIPRRVSVLKDFIAFWKMFFLFSCERPHMVHGNTPKGALLSMAAGFFARVPVRVFMCHGLCYSTATGVKRRVLKMMERATCFFSTHTIAVSYGLKRELISGKFCSSKKIALILNGCVSGIDLRRFVSGNKVAAKTALRCTEKNFVFGFVGRIVRDKGVEELVAAFMRLRKEFPDIRLVLVGEVERANPVSEKTLGAIAETEEIIHFGYQKDLPGFYQGMDCFVFPSYREGFGMVVAEAGACGVPAIVSDINGCNEIIREGENGTIIPPRDADALYRAMKLFYEERETLLPKLAARSRELVASRYEQRAVWDAALEMYRNLTDK